MLMLIDVVPDFKDQEQKYWIRGPEGKLYRVYEIPSSVVAICEEHVPRQIDPK